VFKQLRVPPTGLYSWKQKHLDRLDAVEALAAKALVPWAKELAQLSKRLAKKLIHAFLDIPFCLVKWRRERDG
jgi:hypothetical protein